MKLNIYDEMNNFNQSNLVVKLNLDSENNLIDQIRYTTHHLQKGWDRQRYWRFCSFYWRRIRHHSWLILGEWHSSFYIEICWKLNNFSRIVLKAISIRISTKDFRIERYIFFEKNHQFTIKNRRNSLVCQVNFYLHWNEDSRKETSIGKNLETLRHGFFLRLIDQSASITKFELPEL